MKSVVLLNVLLLLVGVAMGQRDPICNLQPFVEGFGKAVCLAYMPSFSYNAANNECAFWVYGGCGSNNNIFKTKEECEARCKQ